MESWLQVEPAASGAVWSHHAGLHDLVAPCVLSPGIEDAVAASSLRSWTVAWSVTGAEVVFPVSAHALRPPSAALVPVRQFSWRPGQRHRPGLGYSTSTGRLHGFESLAERRLLLVLDFVPGTREVLSQPFTLRFTVADRRMAHVPDFAVFHDDGLLTVVDVRPGGRGERADALKFAATARAASAAGWSYVLVAGWRSRAVEVLEVLAGRRRPMQDPFGLQDRLLAAVKAGPTQLRQLAATTGLPAVARTHLLHLIWHRRLAVDLDCALNDAAWIHPIGAGR
ncbi:TnsA-like heteromeric transposase endonuclease subunit [Streptomyces sp. RTGN2]|uniref:TnsA-like heteromeric transposase endonuclease subunit n=1 Tax=Streptomyces sp. RTGN2 TaxID=3016525 RepID=UPI002553C4F5|nr:TnsA-like heteromeric transposase endonuclease subunit [Streptomyces sp. RTGN2]